MCLSVAVKRPNDVLEKGEHIGHEYNIVHNRQGYRCGYIKVEPGHPWFGKGYDDINANVHGGLTFAAADVACDQGGADNGWWLGFDCAHGGDAPDPSLPSEMFTPALYGTIKTTDYIREQCFSLCEQARAAAA
jgi:hypothetical protein